MARSCSSSPIAALLIVRRWRMFPEAGIRCWRSSSSVSTAANRLRSGRSSRKPRMCMKGVSRDNRTCVAPFPAPRRTWPLFLTFQFHHHFVFFLAVLEARPFRLERVLVNKREGGATHVHVLV